MTIDGYVLDLTRDCQGVFTIETILEQSAVTISSHLYLFWPVLLGSALDSCKIPQ